MPDTHCDFSPARALDANRCPWCGGPPRLFEGLCGVQVVCRGCLCCGPVEESEDEAVRQWDRVRVGS